MKRKYFFEKGNWDEACWIFARERPERILDETETQRSLKKIVVDKFTPLSLSDLQLSKLLVNSSLMALPSVFMQRAGDECYESVYVHFWHCLTTGDYSSLHIHTEETSPPSLGLELSSRAHIDVAAERDRASLLLCCKCGGMDMSLE